MPKYQFTVEVQPRFLPAESAPGEGVYSFAYTVTITNTGEVAAQLISRHWIIADANGSIEQVKGLGVVGHQPLLQPGQSFQYTSGCRLRTPAGSMHGSYQFTTPKGQAREVAIARFELRQPGSLH